MKDLAEIIEQLEDFELAYLVKNRFDEFMESSQNKILFEFLKRGYEKKDAEEILNRKSKEPKTINSKYLVCNNCGSMNFYTVEHTPENEYFTKFDSEQILSSTEFFCWICNTCGQVIATQRPSFWDRLLGRNRNYSKRIE